LTTKPINGTICKHLTISAEDVAALIPSLPVEELLCQLKSFFAS